MVSHVTSSLQIAEPYPPMDSSEHSQCSVMTGFTDNVCRNIPPPLPPRLYAPMKPVCLCQPSSSEKCLSQQGMMKLPDSFNLFPHGLEPPPSDFDANSVGFVDIEQLRELEELDKASVISVPVLPATVKRTSFASLRKWMPRRCSATAHCYDNWGTAIEHPAQNHLREMYLRGKVLRSSSTSSVKLPCPSKKRSLRRTLRKFVFCGFR